MGPRTTRIVLAAGGSLIVLGVIAGAVLYDARTIAVAAADAGMAIHVVASTVANMSPHESADAGAEMQVVSDSGIATTAAVSSAAESQKKNPDASAGLETAVPLDGAHDAGSRAKGTPTVNLNEGSAGKTIELAAGQSMVLLLNANSTSGFDWAVMKAPATLGTPAMSYLEGAGEGAPGKRRLTWTLKSALPPGEHIVQLGYARSFEPGVAPFKMFQFNVRPKP